MVADRLGYLFCFLTAVWSCIHMRGGGGACFPNLALKCPVSVNLAWYDLQKFLLLNPPVHSHADIFSHKHTQSHRHTSSRNYNAHDVQTSTQTQCITEGSVRPVRVDSMSVISIVLTCKSIHCWLFQSLVEVSVFESVNEWSTKPRLQWWDVKKSFWGSWVCRNI